MERLLAWDFVVTSWWYAIWWIKPWNWHSCRAWSWFLRWLFGAWCIGITNVDPIRHGLLFERSSTLSVSTCQMRTWTSARHAPWGDRVSEWTLRRRLRCRHPNFTYLGAASALRDTARIYGWSPQIWRYQKNWRTSRMIASIGRAARTTGKPRQIRDKISDAFNAACKLQSLMRGYGRHAQGWS